ncbi:MAG: GMP synthase [Saprospiraceae bacterium]|nr:GMP synthase [Saprospiraceae bacterium]
MSNIRLAIIDLYNGIPNQGMRCIKEIVDSYQKDLSWKVFNLRQALEVPNLEDYDIYVFTGGPGNPLEGDGVWDEAFFQLVDDIWSFNRYSLEAKKYAFFICHSFQMASNHFGLGSIEERHSASFGTYPVYLTDAALDDPILGDLPNPFVVADFRDFQLIKPNLERFEEIGAEILALEKIRPHVDYERAIMAVRFSDEILGVQFHPEADPFGMLKHFQEESSFVQVINEHGKEKYANMIRDLSHPDKIELTHNTILPAFLHQAIRSLQEKPILSIPS